jgi:hypothetical protein
VPSTTITIDREPRQTLHRMVRRHVSGIQDVDLMIKAGDFAAAERHGREFREDVLLLDALGWDPDDSRDTYALTAPPEELIRMLTRLREDAEGGLNPPEEARRAHEEHDELIEHFRRARDICTELITGLDPSGDVA